MPHYTELNSLKPKPWCLQHICTNQEHFPIKFFAHSPFGQSVTSASTCHRHTASSKLNIPRFRQLGFPTEYCDTLEYGLPLLLTSIPPNIRLKNYSSIEEHHVFVEKTLKKWHELQFYTTVNTPPHVISPLGVAVKNSKPRLIVDATASGLNKHLATPKFILPSHSDIIRGISTHDYLCKADFENGFLQLPIQHEDQTYLGFIHPFTREYCTFTRLPFGLGPATFLFQTFSSGIKHFLNVAFGLHLDVYIDDWLIKHPSETGAAAQLELFHNVCKFLNVTINPAKSEGPSNELKFLGLRIDTLNNNLTLPEDKREKYLNDISKLLINKNPTMADLVQVAGKLVHVSSIHTNGWAHTQSLWNVLYNENREWTRKQLRNTHCHKTRQLNDDLQWWRETLTLPINRKIWMTPDGQLFLWDRHAAENRPDAAITISTDASDHGWGATLGVLTIAGTWSRTHARQSINWRETKAVINALLEWTCIRDRPVLVLTDNITAIAIINQRRPNMPHLITLAQHLTQLEQNRGIQLQACHLPGALNDLADALSRQKQTVVAAPLDCNIKTLKSLAAHTPTVIGLQSPTAIPFPRSIPINQPSSSFLIACTTTDLPYLQQHLNRWTNNEIDHDGLILTPDIPSSLMITTGVTKTQVLEPLLAATPGTRWRLLTWSATQARKHWCHVKDAKRTQPQQQPPGLVLPRHPCPARPHTRTDRSPSTTSNTKAPMLRNNPTAINISGV